jgi:hypothetical protein
LSDCDSVGEVWAKVIETSNKTTSKRIIFIRESSFLFDFP